MTIWTRALASGFLLKSPETGHNDLGLIKNKITTSHAKGDARSSIKGMNGSSQTGQAWASGIARKVIQFLKPGGGQVGCMFSVVMMLLFFACALIIDIKFGVFMGLGFFVLWSLGIVLASVLIGDFGRPIHHADRVLTITKSQQFDFALAIFWPIGIPVILGIAIGRRIRETSRRP